MSSGVWGMEWQVALGRPRLFAWNVAVPLMLLVPVALSEAALPHRAVVFTVFFGFFAVFGSCIPVIRDATSGWIETVSLTGCAPRRAWAERIAAAATLDLAQLAPVGLVLLWASAGWTWAGAVLAGLALALLAGAAIGTLVAAAVRSLAEGALASAAVTLFLLHLAGVFRAPVAPWAVSAARWSPFRPLHQALIGLSSGRTGPAEGLAGGLPDVGPALLTTAFLIGLFLLAAPAIDRRLRWPLTRS